MNLSRDEVRLVRPTPADAAVIAGWSRSAEEAARWCSRAEHPFPAAAVLRWWDADDVEPWLLVSERPRTPLAYGELWHDEEEDEVELARLIVAADRRRTGLGRLLVAGLVSEARASGRAACCLRVAPDNTSALALYRSAGFRDVDPDRSAAWNEGQPVAYVWLERLDFPSRGANHLPQG
ncbi:MAG: GNAT family N-acetyltransferase [Propionibacteriaceae bacterium]